MLRADVVIIGAGIAGVSIARELSRYSLNIIVVEEKTDVAFGPTKASSSIIQPDYGKPGSNIARYTTASNFAIEGLCRELAVDFRRCGEVFVALDEKELPVLDGYIKSAEANGSPPIKRLSRDEVLKLEPNVCPEVVAGAIAPAAGFVYSFELSIGLFENAKANGVEFLFDTEVLGGSHQDNGDLLLETTKSKISTRSVINCAGIYADHVAGFFGDDTIQITPQRGQEIILDRRLSGLVRHIVHGCPAGIIVPTTHGNILLGTTAETESDKGAELFTSAEGFNKIFKICKKMVPELRTEDVITSFAGLRAKNNTEDQIVKISETCPRLLNVCLVSPGVTASPAMSKEIPSFLEEMGLKLTPKESFNPIRQPVPDFSELSDKEKDEIIRRDPRYGRVICRCETVTEGEIVEAIRRGARTLDGVKYRVRAGMGRCQGGFCGPRVLAILSRELGLPVHNLTKKGKNSIISGPKTKALLVEGM